MDCKNEFHSDDDFDCSSNGFSDNNHNQNSGYNSNGQRSGNQNGMSKAELRKTNKPIMEKRRRARINHCLNELKSLILEAMKKDPARHTKLEKADILEMTVKHLQSVQRQQLNVAIQTDPSVIHKFKTGFVECADEVNRYVSQLDGIDAGVRQRLTQHLSTCASGLEQIGSMTNFNNGYRSANPASLFGGVGATLPTSATITAPGSVLFPTAGVPQDLNNNNHLTNVAQPGQPIQMGGVQLIPSRLPSGEFALIMPNTNTNPASLLNVNNNNNSAGNPMGGSPFASWPHGTAGTGVSTGGNASSQVNDFASNFKRMSAFSKPAQMLHQQQAIAPQSQPQPQHQTITYTGSTQQPTKITTAFNPPQNCLAQNSTTTTSPPLSPISSVSSHGDDSSMMHTSSDFGASRPATPPRDFHPNANNFSGVFSTPPSAESSLTLSLTNSTTMSITSNSTSSRLSVHLQQQQVSSTSGCESALKRSLCSNETTSADSSDSSDEPSAKRFASTKKELDFDETERDSMWRPW